MSDFLSRRDWIKTVGVVGAGALVPHDGLLGEPAVVEAAPSIATPVAYASGEIVDLVSTSEIFIPPRGRSYMKFSFDFPEPSLTFGDYRFGFLVFTDENTYALDRAKLRVEGSGDAAGLRRLHMGRWAGESTWQARRIVSTNRRDDRMGRRRRDGPADQNRDVDRSRSSARSGLVWRRRVQ